MIDIYDQWFFDANEAKVTAAQDRQIDREQFVHNLGMLLSQTRESIEGAFLDDKERVHVVYNNGYEKLVNVNMDSYTAIIKDVAKHI